MFDAPFVPIEVGEHSLFVAAGDFNRDGWPDLAATNQYSNSVSVLIAQGFGEYHPAIDYPVAAPSDLAIADVTDDGVPDLIVVSTSLGSIAVLPGRGDGTFAAAEDHPTTWPPARLAIADLDRDGRSDIVVECGSFIYATSIEVFLARPGGSLVPLAPVNFAWPAPVGLALGDLNSDGRVDIVTAHGVFQATVLVALGRGDGTFGTPTALFDSPSLAAVTLTDLDSDGWLDLVLGAGGTSGRIGVRLGLGNGSFGPSIDFGLGQYVSVTALAAADLDRDGRQDLLVAVPGGLRFLQGVGNGRFSSQTPLNCWGSTSAIVVGDLNGDGMTDAAVAGTTSGGPGTHDAVSVILGDGHGGSLGPVVASGIGCASAASGDLNGDGIPDLVTANFDGQTVSVLLGLGGARFAPPQTFSPGGVPWRATLADLNADGRVDLVLTYVGGATALSVQDGLGDGTFGPRRDYMSNPDMTGESFAAVGDFNRDGKPDLATVNRYTNLLSILLGEGNGTFPTHVDYPVAAEPAWIVVADINRDGKQDLAVATLGGYTAPGLLSCHMGRGDGTFSAPASYETGTQPASVAAGDVNGDGWPDLVTRNIDSATLSVLLNNRSGGFPSHVEYWVAEPGWWVGIGRFDGDQAPDLVAANSFGNTVSLLRGLGDGTFVPAGELGSGTNPQTGVVLDLNNDGFLDVALANRGSSNLGLLIGRRDLPTATQLSLVSLDAHPDYVRLVWNAGGGGSVLAGVQRREPGIDWATLAMVASDGTGMLMYEDRTVAGGAQYDYRLVEPGSADHVLAPEVRVSVPAALELSLESPRPNPVTASSLTVWVTLPDQSRATLDLLDVSGRRIEAREIGAMGPGRVPVMLGAEHRIRPGVYMIRLRTSSRSLTRRAVVIQSR